MEYIIYELVSPEQLTKVEFDGYYARTISRSVLSKLDVSGVNPQHDTMESAISEIKEKSVFLKFRNLTILPVITVKWDGEVS